jgi:hypothetical protein
VVLLYEGEKLAGVVSVSPAAKAYAVAAEGGAVVERELAAEVLGPG